SACSSTSAPASLTDASTTDSAASDTSAIDTGAADTATLDSGARDAADAADATAIEVASDATSVDGSTPSCLGDSYPITIAGQLPFVPVVIGTSSARFLFDTATTYSSIDPSGFTPGAPTSTNCSLTPALGASCSYSELAFLGASPPASLVVESFGTIGGVREGGILATDFTSLGVYTIDWTGSRAHVATSTSFCARSALLGLGWRPLSTAGFFSSSLASLRPLGDVQAGATSGFTVPNVPTIPSKIAGVSAFTQIDTGFDDDVTHHSVNVNVAFYAAIVAADSGALVRDASLDLSLSTCAGVSEPVQAYTLASGRSFTLVADDGSTARSFSDAVIFVKQTPAAAKSCGGIGTWTVPAAQIGGSFAESLGIIAFDPYASVVWVAPG
ncbi:MAG: hypothetical protein ACHREM_28015, partial [Polyangiales bacterium]